ncbi:MAG TPA: TraX family protein [Trueperaceae bacterium]|nr:TraX family protein [Trueperaceae bacterium]
MSDLHHEPAHTPLAPRLDSGQQEVVRWFAMLCMVIDHVGAVLLPADAAQPLRFIGRIAWPLFAFLMAYNVAARGVDPLRYLRPLLLWVLVAQLPHYLLFGWLRVSILGALFLAATALTLLLRAGIGPSGMAARPTSRLAPAYLVIGLIGVWLLASYVEYGQMGVLLVLALWWAVGGGGTLAWVAAIGATALVNYPWSNWPGALLAVPVMFLAGRLPLRLPRSGQLPWLFYPAHLLILWLVSLVLG